MDSRADIADFVTIKLYKPNSSGRMTTLTWESASYNSGWYNGRGAIGMQANTSLVNAIRFQLFNTGGNFGANSVIKVYGIS